MKDEIGQRIAGALERVVAHLDRQEERILAAVKRQEEQSARGEALFKRVEVVIGPVLDKLAAEVECAAAQGDLFAAPVADTPAS